MTTSQLIYNKAKEYLGTHEIDGPKSNPIVQQWIRQAADWLDSDDSKTPWCGCFRGAIGLLTGTGVPKDHFRAAEWAKWGKSVPLDKPSEWQQGDTIVMARPGGNHVTLLDRVAGNYAYCLGGNQSDAVTISRFALDRITAVRR